MLVLCCPVILLRSASKRSSSSADIAADGGALCDAQPQPQPYVSKVVLAYERPKASLRLRAYLRPRPTLCSW